MIHDKPSVVPYGVIMTYILLCSIQDNQYIGYSRLNKPSRQILVHEGHGK